MSDTVIIETRKQKYANFIRHHKGEEPTKTRRKEVAEIYRNLRKEGRPEMARLLYTRERYCRRILQGEDEEVVRKELRIG